MSSQVGRRSSPLPTAQPSSSRDPQTEPAAAQTSAPGTQDASAPSSSTGETPTYGPHIWQELRKQWTTPTKDAKPPKRESVLPVGTTYDDLLLSRNYFDEPVPLAEMIELLIDEWIQDGLYD